MIYLSIGELVDNPTVNRSLIKCGGQVIALTGRLRQMWFKGRLRIAECEFEDEELLKTLYKKGLVVIGNDYDYDTKYNMLCGCIVSSAKSSLKVSLTENEKMVYQWLRFAPFILHFPEMLSIYERGIKVEGQYIGQRNAQALVKLILEPHGQYKNQKFFKKMFYSKKRDELVDIYLGLLSKGKIILIQRKDSLYG